MRRRSSSATKDRAWTASSASAMSRRKPARLSAPSSRRQSGATTTTTASPDLYVSVLGGPNRLYRNRGDGSFEDVAPRLGVTGPRQSFPAWFWDFDNDGHLDLFVSSYTGDRGGLGFVAASYQGYPGPWEQARLYRGDGDGGFEDVAARSGLTRLQLPMGSNFGDLDHDGYLDFYLGTGYPDYEAVMPNVLYRNLAGRRFVDVSLAAGFGHLQKGHAVAFADLDGDGDLDVFEQMGGALSRRPFRRRPVPQPRLRQPLAGAETGGSREQPLRDRRPHPGRPRGPGQCPTQHLPPRERRRQFRRQPAPSDDRPGQAGGGRANHRVLAGDRPLPELRRPRTGSGSTASSRGVTISNSSIRVPDSHRNAPKERCSCRCAGLLAGFRRSPREGPGASSPRC